MDKCTVAVVLSLDSLRFLVDLLFHNIFLLLARPTVPIKVSTVRGFNSSNFHLKRRRIHQVERTTPTAGTGSTSTINHRSDYKKTCSTGTQSSSSASTSTIFVPTQLQAREDQIRQLYAVIVQQNVQLGQYASEIEIKDGHIKQLTMELHSILSNATYANTLLYGVIDFHKEKYVATVRRIRELEAMAAVKPVFCAPASFAARSAYQAQSANANRFDGFDTPIIDVEMTGNEHLSQKPIIAIH